MSIDEPKEKEFGEITIILSPLPAMKAALRVHRLGKCFLPSLTMMFGSLSGVKNVSDLDLAAVRIDKISDAVEALFTNLKEEDLEFFIKEFVSPGVVRKKGPDGGDIEMPLQKTIDTVFQGQTLLLFKVLAWAIYEVNYPDFFVGLRGFMQKLEAFAASLMTKGSISKTDLPTKKN